jgi:hypothetical protein
MDLVMSRLLVVILAVFLSGCASTGFAPRFEKPGKFDPELSSSIDQRAHEMAWSEARDVEVYIGEGPEGVSINENGRLVFDESEWEVLGKVVASPNSDDFFYEYPEDQNWRNSYCGVNSVLRAATLGFWVVTPFPWTCIVKDGNSAEDIKLRKMRIVNTLKKATRAAGGDFVVITSLGNLEYKNVEGRVLNTIDIMSAEGFALRKLLK